MLPSEKSNRSLYGGMPHSETEIDILKINASGIKKNNTNQKYGVKTNQKFCLRRKLFIKKIDGLTLP